VTGAGSLSSSPQPVTEIPADLSLFGDPSRLIGAVCSTAPSLFMAALIAATWVSTQFANVMSCTAEVLPAPSSSNALDFDPALPARSGSPTPVPT
jgi:hypothetical protein